ncbi:hypothetical protein TNCV_2115531 [Trichonephila clavipes]|nr:hypothetical protein TNCV_2115531 [Trichonephila clavipes]
MGRKQVTVVVESLTYLNFSIENFDPEAIPNLVSDELKCEPDFVALSWWLDYYFISRYRGTGKTFTTGPCVLYLEPYEGAWLKDIWDRSARCVCCPSRPSIDATIWSG